MHMLTSGTMSTSSYKSACRRLVLSLMPSYKSACRRLVLSLMCSFFLQVGLSTTCPVVDAFLTRQPKVGRLVLSFSHSSSSFWQKRDILRDCATFCLSSIMLWPFSTKLGQKYHWLRPHVIWIWTWYDLWPRNRGQKCDLIVKNNSS